MGPLLTATVLNNLAREIGVYLHLMKFLPSISDEIWDGITQLFEYYVYTVYSIFSPPLETYVNSVCKLLTDTPAVKFSHKLICSYEPKIKKLVVAHEISRCTRHFRYRS